MAQRRAGDRWKDRIGWLSLALAQPSAQHRDGMFAKRRIANLAPFALASNVRCRAKHDVVAAKAVNAGEKLHRLAGAKLHHGGVGGSWGGICGTDGGCARSRERSSPEAAQRRALGAGLDGESAHRAIIREPRCALVYGRERTTSRYGASVFRRLIG